MKILYDAYNVIMNANVNPLRNIPDMSTRFTVLCVLSVIWSVGRTYGSTDRRSILIRMMLEESTNNVTSCMEILVQGDG